MTRLHRLAVGTVQAGADLQAILWAVLETLRRAGLQVQSFLSQACFTNYHGAATVTGLNPRHLDSWLMSPEVCREVFLRGAAGCDFGLVEGRFVPADCEPSLAGGKLETLCDWLDLPILLVLDVSGLEDCRFPKPPDRADGLLLDRVPEGELVRLSTNLEALWGIPVLGALGALPGLRRAVDAVPRGARPPHDLCRELGNHFARHWQLRRVVELASRSDLPGVPPRLFRAELRRFRTVVAIAYDEAFDCYFPDTLDLLELHGASIVDFSPLRDERLPAGTDIVYLGCGHPERFAEQLAQNDCMKLALRNHLRTGRRIYAEGRGLAYLCQHLESPERELHRMVGIFPAIARLNHQPTEPTPVELTLDRTTWFGRSGSRVRGYRNSGWCLEPIAPLASCVAQQDCRHDLVESSQAVGSRLHLNLAAHPELLPSFFRPPLCCPKALDPWAMMP